MQIVKQTSNPTQKLNKKSISIYYPLTDKTVKQPTKIIDYNLNENLEILKEEYNINLHSKLNLDDCYLNEFDNLNIGFQELTENIFNKFINNEINFIDNEDFTIGLIKIKFDNFKPLMLSDRTALNNQSYIDYKYQYYNYYGPHPRNILYRYDIKYDLDKITYPVGNLNTDNLIENDYYIYNINNDKKASYKFKLDFNNDNNVYTIQNMPLTKNTYPYYIHRNLKDSKPFKLINSNSNYDNKTHIDREFFLKD